MSGERARSLFQASGISDEILEVVWNLVDVEQRGALNESEFIVAMHLLRALKTGSLKSLPRAIPATLWNATARLSSTSAASAIPRQMSGPSAQRTGSPLNRAPAVGVPPTFSWKISPEERANFDKIFSTVDPQNIGQITTEQAAALFRHSNLPDPVLAEVWTLANIRKLDNLDRDEFAVAMKLINSQRGKGPNNFDLPRSLPAELVPLNLQRYVAPQSTGFPTTQPPQQATRPAPQPSASEDLFGLDALTSSPSAPTLQQQGTGGSGAGPRSLEADPFGSKPNSPTTSAFQARSFKPFVPTSSFGQNLQSQTTGGSGTSSTALSREIKSPSAMDDLLGDNDPEISRKLTTETTELANMSNQIGQLRTQMEGVKNDKAATGKELASATSQRREMEMRLAQFRKQYDEEVKAVKILQEQLTLTHRENQNLQRDIAMVEGTTKDLQSQHRQAAAELENEKANNAALKERMNRVNAETARLKPELEEMRSQARQQKGLVSINKKQLEKSEAERDAIKAEINQLAQARQESASMASRDASTVASPAASTASHTNPFMRRSPQQSFDNTMSPGGFARSPTDSAKDTFDNIFGPLTTSQSAAVPSTSFGYASQTGPSITSSEPGPPTPSVSPPASSHRDSPRTAEPPEISESRQMTPGDLPFRPVRHYSESTATSVRVETPVSRIEGAGVETPTGASVPPPLERLETNKSDGSTGAALFGRNKSTSPGAGTSGVGDKTVEDLFGRLPGNTPGGFPGSETSSVKPNVTGESGFSFGSRENTFQPFGREPARSATTSSSKDFDDVFNQSRPSTSGPRANGLGEAAVERIHAEFPPIPSVPEDEDSDLDGEQGFDDDFMHPSPDQKKVVREELPAPDAQKSPPTYGETVSTGAGASRDINQFPKEYGGLLPSRDDPTTGPQPAQSPSQGEAFFGKPATSPPAVETASSSNVPSSDTYHSATSHPSALPVPSQAPQTQKIASFDDEFDEGFENLEEAKADDEAHEDDDDILYSSAQENSYEFNPNFDSPAASKANTLASERTPTNKVQAGYPSSSRPDDSFGDFHDLGTNSGTSMSKSNILPFGGAGIGDNWDAMMKSGTLPKEEPAALSSSTSNKPNLERSMSEASEHDVASLKRLTEMGYSRSMALKELEKYDYDEEKVSVTPKVSPSLLDRPLPPLPAEAAETKSDKEEMAGKKDDGQEIKTFRRHNMLRRMTRKLTRS